MPEIREELKIGDTTFKVTFNIDSFNHLCSFRELSNINLIKTTVDHRFGSNVVVKDLTPEDYAVFLKLFVKSLKSYFSGTSVIGVLYSKATGTGSRWGYVIEKAKALDPFLSQLPVYSTQVLYSRPLPDNAEKTEEITQFNYHLASLYALPTTVADTYIQQLQDALPQLSQTTPDNVLTKEMILNYLRS